MTTIPSIRSVLGTRCGEPLQKPFCDRKHEQLRYQGFMLLYPLSVAASFFAHHFPGGPQGPSCIRKAFFLMGSHASTPLAIRPPNWPKALVLGSSASRCGRCQTNCNRQFSWGGVPGELMPGYDAAGTLLHAVAIDFLETYRYFDCAKLLF